MSTKDTKKHEVLIHLNSNLYENVLFVPFVNLVDNLRDDTERRRLHTPDYNLKRHNHNKIKVP